MIRKRGIYYSRYVDDITWSTNRYISKQEKEEITNLVYGMLRSAKVKPNRGKREANKKGNKMLVHNLNVDKKIPTMEKDERNRIRAAVKQCEEMAKDGMGSDEYLALYNSVKGRVSCMMRLHPMKAKKLLSRLECVDPEK